MPESPTKKATESNDKGSFSSEDPNIGSTGTLPEIDASGFSHASEVLSANLDRILSARVKQEELNPHLKMGEDLKRYIFELVKEYLENSNFYIAVHRSFLLNIIGHGRFVSQYESDVSNGVYDPSMRMQVEMDRFGWDGADVADATIYGYCDPNDGGHLNPASSSKAQQYGDVAVRLKKNTMERRTTFTVGDSLNEGEDGYTVSLPVTYPHYAAASLYISVGGIAKDFRHMKKGRQAGVKQRTLIDYARAYVEAQFHGGVSLDDVEAIYLSAYLTRYLANGEEFVSDIKVALEEKGYGDIGVYLVGS